MTDYKLNREILEKVKQHILANPQTLDMSASINIRTDLKIGRILHADIAGRIVILTDNLNPSNTRYEPRPQIVQTRAIEILFNVDKEEAKEIYRTKMISLFHVNTWPEWLKQRYELQPWFHKTSAEVVAEAIDYYLDNPREVLIPCIIN